MKIRVTGGLTRREDGRWEFSYRRRRGPSIRIPTDVPIDPNSPEPIRLDWMPMRISRSPSARRDRIPDSVRLFVWQRDEGKCVKCGESKHHGAKHPTSMRAV